MPSILPQATVFKEYQAIIPADITAPMRSHIAGPQAELHRYENSAEKTLISVGAYNAASPTTYDYPNIASDSIVDIDSVAVHIDNALLQYFQDLKSVGTTIIPVSGYKNRIVTAASNGFKANTATYPRLAALKDRDVAIGDVVFLQDSTNTQTTSVAGFIADQVAASISAATSDAGNDLAQPNSTPGSAPTVAATGGGSTGGLLQAGTYFVRYSFTGPFGETSASDASTLFTVSAGNIPRVTIPATPTGATSAKIYLSPTSGTALQCTLYKTGVVTTTTDLTIAYTTGAAYPPSNTQISGTANDVSISLVDTSTYNGLATGDITETYTIQVTTGGAGGVAVLSVTSASGRDDVASVTTAAFASQTTIGARGLKVTFVHTSDNLVIGQTWQMTVRQAWATATPTSDGAFTGNNDITYIVTVTRGGKYSDSTKPQITVTSNTGIDSSGPTTVTAATTDFAIGTLGVNVQFAGAGLNKGDIYYVPVVGPTAGAYKTLLLTDNLTVALQSSTDMSLTLYLKKNVTVPVQRVSAPPTTNWTVTANNVLVNSGIDAANASLTDSGVPFYVPIVGGTVYISYRAWTTANAGTIVEVSDQASAEAALGITFANISPDHVLPYAVKKAVENCNGQVVKFSGIADPDNITDWNDVLALLAGYNDVFTLVPLSRDPAVISAYQAHVLARSSDDVGGEWRHAWFCLAAEDAMVVVDHTTASNGQTVMATLGDNPSVTNTQYTLFSVTSGNGKFVTNNVQAGDQVRYLFTVDAFGNPTYTTFTVASVVNEDSLLVTVGNISAVTQTQKIEVYRVLTPDQAASQLASQMTGGNVNERFKYLWPDKFTDEDGLVVDGFYGCAAYAAMIGGIAPHQGLRQVSISGFSAVPRATSFFNNGQLNTLAAAGFVIASKAPTGEVFTLFARTPDLSSVASREEVTVRLDDAIRYLFWNTAMENRGNGNLTGALLAKIRTDLQSAIGHALSDTNIDRIGSMLTSGTIVTLRPHLTIQDRLVLEVSVVRPFPLNDTTLTLTF